MPSIFSVAAATTEVPGQKPPMTKPTPITTPPRISGQRKVGLTQTRFMSSSPKPVASPTSTAATTMAVNITRSTVRSRK